MRTKLAFIQVCVFLMLGLFYSALAFGKSYQVDDLIFLPQSKYPSEVEKVLKSAKESIYITMYAIIARDRDYHPVNNLVWILLDAHKRGVKVKVILENSLKEKNQLAYKLLSKEGIEVKYDKEKILTHTKLLVIDEYITILGSANWTYSAFEMNNESSVLIKSKEIAEIFLSHIKAIDAGVSPADVVLAEVPFKAMARKRIPVVTVNNAQVHFQMGCNYYQNKMYDKAIQELKKSIEIDSKHTQARYYLNLCYKAKGEEYNETK